MSKSFVWLWSGQLVSLLGSALTGFGISLWAFEHSQSPYVLSLTLFAKLAPSIYLSLFAGQVVDRVHAKTMIIVTDVALLTITVALWLLVSRGALDLPLLLALLFLSGVVEAFQAVAFQTTIADFVRPEFYDRGQGLVAFIENAPLIVAPALGAIAYQQLGLPGVLLLDSVSFAVVLVLAWRITFPTPKPRAKTPFSLAAAKWIWQQPLLARLQTFFLFSNFFNGLAGGLVAAFVLLKTSGSESSLAIVQTGIAAGTLLGALAVLTFGLRGRAQRWITIGTGAAALTGRVGIALVNSVPLWTAGLGLRSILVPIVSSANQTLWLKEVPRETMGAVFGARRVFGQGLYPVAVFIGGWLAKEPFKDNLAGLIFFIGLAELFVAVSGLIALRSARDVH